MANRKKFVPIVRLSDLSVDDRLRRKNDHSVSLVTAVGTLRALLVREEDRTDEFSVTLQTLRAYWEREVDVELPIGWEFDPSVVYANRMTFTDWASDTAIVSSEGIQPEDRRVVVRGLSGNSIHLKKKDLEFMLELLNGEGN